MAILGSDIMLTAAMAAFVVVSVVGVYAQTRWHLYELLVGKKRATLVHAAFEGLTFIEFLLVAAIVLATSKKSLPLAILGLAVGLYAAWQLAVYSRHHGLKKLGQVYFFGAKVPLWDPKKPIYRQMPLGLYCLLCASWGLIAGRPAFLVCGLLLVIRFWLVDAMIRARRRT